MENFSQAITIAILNFSPNIQVLMLFLFSYGEGLPIVGTILPGGTIAILAGSLTQSGVFSVKSALLAVILGSFLGDMTGFLIGKKLKNFSFVKKLIEKDSWQKGWEIFDRNFFVIVVFGKLIPGIRSAPSLIFGARNMPLKKYAIYSFLGSLLWGLIGILAGNMLAKIIGDYAIPLIVAILFIIIIFTIATLIIKKTKNKS